MAQRFDDLTALELSEPVRGILGTLYRRGGHTPPKILARLRAATRELLRALDALSPEAGKRAAAGAHVAEALGTDLVCRPAVVCVTDGVHFSHVQGDIPWPCTDLAELREALGKRASLPPESIVIVSISWLGPEP